MWSFRSYLGRWPSACLCFAWSQNCLVFLGFLFQNSLTSFLDFSVCIRLSIRSRSFILIASSLRVYPWFVPCYLPSRKLRIDRSTTSCISKMTCVNVLRTNLHNSNFVLFQSSGCRVTVLVSNFTLLNFIYCFHYLQRWVSSCIGNSPVIYHFRSDDSIRTLSVPFFQKPQLFNMVSTFFLVMNRNLSALLVQGDFRRSRSATSLRYAPRKFWLPSLYNVTKTIHAL